GERACGDRTLFRQCLFLASQSSVIGFWDLDRREEPEVDVHRLEGALAGLVIGEDVPTGYVVQQRAESCRRRRRIGRHTEALRCREAAGYQPHRSTFHIALAAGDLTGEAQSRPASELQCAVEERW